MQRAMGARKRQFKKLFQFAPRNDAQYYIYLTKVATNQKKARIKKSWKNLVFGDAVAPVKHH
jgi:hypothetical protein